MNFRKGLADEVELNLTPLIDVVFLLLIFFMVTTTFDRDAKIKINLPQQPMRYMKRKRIRLSY